MIFKQSFRGKIGFVQAEKRGKPEVPGRGDSWTKSCNYETAWHLQKTRNNAILQYCLSLKLLGYIRVLSNGTVTEFFHRNLPASQPLGVGENDYVRELIRSEFGLIFFFFFFCSTAILCDKKNPMGEKSLWNYSSQNQFKNMSQNFKMLCGPCKDQMNSYIWHCFESSPMLIRWRVYDTIITLEINQSGYLNV